MNHGNANNNQNHTFAQGSGSQPPAQSVPPGYSYPPGFHPQNVMYGQPSQYYPQPAMPYMGQSMPLNITHMHPFGFSFGHHPSVPLPPMPLSIGSPNLSTPVGDVSQQTPNNNPENLKAIENYIFSLISGGRDKSEDTSPKSPIESHSPQIIMTSSNSLDNTSDEDMRGPSPQITMASSVSSENVWIDDVISHVEAEHNLDPKDVQEDPKFKRSLKSISKNTTPPLTDAASLIPLTEQCIALFNELKPASGEFGRRMKVLKRLQKIISNSFLDGNPNLHIFGSSANMFGMKDCDMDISLIINEKVAGSPKRIVMRLADVLRRKRMKEMVCLPRARVPIVKFKDEVTDISCDICVNNTLAIHNTQLIGSYSKIDIRARQMGYVIKHWAKNRLINEPYQGTLSSYAYIVMVLHFLQTRNPPVLPVLQHMTAPGEERNRVEVEGHDVYFYKNIETLKEFGSQNTSTLGELITGFFRLYAEEFDWNENVVSMRTGRYLTKAEKGWAKQVHDRDNILFTIEDPFEVTHNLGRLVDKANLKVIKYEFKRAYKLASSGSPLSKICEQYIPEEEK